MGYNGSRRCDVLAGSVICLLNKGIGCIRRACRAHCFLSVGIAGQFKDVLVERGPRMARIAVVLKTGFGDIEFGTSREELHAVVDLL